MRFHKLPTVECGCLVIPEELQSYVMDLVNAKPWNGKIVSGPHCVFNIIDKDEDIHINAGVWTAHGSVADHTDAAGKALSVVLATTGTHELKVGSKTWPLVPGTIFYIDTDEIHSTISKPGSLMVFASVDCSWDGIPASTNLPSLGQSLIESLIAHAGISMSA